jgi:hypothetical protein
LRTNSGTNVEGKTPSQLVASLRNQAFNPEKDTRTFMRYAAQRARVQTGKPVRYNNAVNFINDLKSAGLLHDE